MEVRKLKRTANYSPEDRRLLIRLALKYKDTLENKASNASTWKQKEEAWKKIADEFNSQVTGSVRDAKCLRSKYETIKKGIRKESAEARKEVLKTGGGPPLPPKPYDPLEDQLKAVIQLSVDGLINGKDSDGTYCELLSCDNNNIVTAAYSEEQLEITDKELWNDDVEIIRLEPERNVQWEPENTAQLIRTTPVSKTLLVHDEPRVISGEKVNHAGDTLNNNPGAATKMIGGSCDKYPKKKKRCQSSVAEKFEKLAEEKMKLISLQKELIHAALQNQEKEHHLRMKVIQDEHEQKIKLQHMEHNMRVEVIRKENVTNK